MAERNIPSMFASDRVCPLLSIVGDDLARCQRSNCAWWDRERNQCAMLSFRDGLTSLEDVITVDVLKK
ncbi:MAG: hypothetical protein IJX71_03095 [Oscillospiraceae bacterium]|nr:hypothetical protein [Oscillospiraceae bacterium]